VLAKLPHSLRTKPDDLLLAVRAAKWGLQPGQVWEVSEVYPVPISFFPHQTDSILTGRSASLGKFFLSVFSLLSAVLALGLVPGK
jgi:hypothetical protein